MRMDKPNQQSIPDLDANPNYDQKHHEKRDSYNMEARLLKPTEEGVNYCSQTFHQAPVKKALQIF